MKLFNKLKKINPLASIAADGLLSDIDYYIDTGSFALNALLSGSIYKGFPGNRIVGFAGPTSAGKTYLTISILKNYQKMSEDNFVICYDTEGRLTKDKLIDAGIVGSRYFHAPISNLEQFKNEIIQGLALIKEEVGFGDQKGKKEVEEISPEELLSDQPEKEEKPKEKQKRENYFFVLDSLSQAGSLKEEQNALDGKNAADMGLRAKLIKSVFRNITMDLNILKYPMIVTSHVYDSMDQYKPSIIAGGTGLQYAASVIVECLPTKDSIVVSGKRVVKGTNVRCILRKSELTKQWKSVTIKVNFAKGLDRYSGLFDICFENDIIKREGKKYIFPDGNKYFMKEIEESPETVFTKESLDIIDKELDKIFSYGKDNDVVTTEEDKNKVVENVNKELQEESAEIPDINTVLNSEDEKATDE